MKTLEVRNNIKDLTSIVKEHSHCQFEWELHKKYTAIDIVTGKVLAEYNPKNGKLKLY